MASDGTIRSDFSFEQLRQFVRRKRANEICELCSQELAVEHSHLLEIANRKLLCACEGCALLFSSQVNARYRRVPRQIRKLVGFQISDDDWDSLLIPINIAFFSQSSLSGKVAALYPSPAGATESLLPEDGWHNIVSKNPVLSEMDQDVEALLVNRLLYSQGKGEADYFIAPMDECFRLTGLIRMHWKGLSGGTEVWQEIHNFFLQLNSKCLVTSANSYA
jgi:Family of unknown function (DUF5947)